MKHFLFYLILLYYLILNYFTYEEIERFSSLYFFLTIPILLYVLGMSAFLIKKYSYRTLVLAILLLLTVMISLFRADVRTIMSSFLLISTLIILVNSGINLNVKVLNYFFLMAVLGSIMSYHIGINPYGYLPNLKNISQLDLGGVGIKISLFPLTPESGFFSLFIIICNYHFNPSKSRFIFYLLGGYFLIFSGLRTAIAIFLFFVCFEIFSNFKEFRYRPVYVLLNPLFIIVFIILSNLKSFHVLVSKSDNELVKAIVLRNEREITSTTSTEDVATRTWIWKHHFRIFAQNPVFGVGTYNFADYIPDKSKSYHYSTGSESFLTSWLARIGPTVLLIVLFTFMTQFKSLKVRNKFIYAMCLYFLIVMIYYGSFIVPYNFMFLLVALSLGQFHQSQMY